MAQIKSSKKLTTEARRTQRLPLSVLRASVVSFVSKGVAVLYCGLLFTCLCAMGRGDELGEKAQRAREAMASGRYKEAISVYQDLARALPGDPGLKMNLGIAHYMEGHYLEATRQLEAAVKADPKLTQALLFIGASQQQLGNPARAVPTLQKYVQIDGKDSRGRQLLGEAQLATQKFEKAAEQFEALSNLEPQNPKAWYGMGKSYEGLAVRTFESLEKAAPDSAYWFALVAPTRVAQRQYRSAFFFYRKALEKKPNLRGIHVALSQIYRKTGNPEWASREEEKEVQLGLPDCEAEKTVCDFLAGRFHDVVISLKNKQTPESYYWISQAYNQLALDAFSRLESLPPSFEMHEVMAEIHRNQGRHLESVNEWKKALELSPGNPIARKELALSLVLMHDYEAAKPLVDSLLAEEPGSAQLNYLSGECLLNQQRPAEAIPLLKKAVVSNPDFASAHASLGRAYMNTGQSASAIPHLKSALALDEDGSLHYQLARAYRSTGAKELASQMLRKYEEIQQSLQVEKEKLEKEVRITPP